MTDLFLRLNSLVAELDSQLCDEDYMKFCSVLDKFKRNPKDPMAVLEELKELSSNPELMAELSSIATNYNLPTSLPDDLAKFMLQVNKMSGNKKMGHIIGELISYYSEGFIPLDFLHHYLNFLLADLDREHQNLIHWGADEIAVRIKVGRMELQDDHEYTLFNAIPHELNLQPLFDVPMPLQFLCMVNLIVPDASNVVSIVKCLKLYSSRMINISEACEWIGHFDEYIKTFFTSMIMKYDPSSLSAVNIKASIDAQLKSKTLQVWAFGNTILEQLANQPVPECVPDRSLSLSSNDERIGLVPSIMEFQTNAFFRQLKGAAEDVQDLRPIEINPDIINALYGRTISMGHAAAGVVINRCQKVGAKVLDSHFQYYQRVMEQFDTSSEEWRIHYGHLLDAYHVRQIILFQGLNVQLPEKKDWELVFDICQRFMRHFKTIDTFTEIRKVFEEKSPLYMSVHAAMFVYYFVASMHLILCAKEQVSIEDIKKIPETVFACSAPIRDFGGSMLANIDIPLLKMAKMLKKVKTNFVFSESPAKVLLSSNEPFFYQSTIEDGELKIIAAINPEMSQKPDNAELDVTQYDQEKKDDDAGSVDMDDQDRTDTQLDDDETQGEENGE